MPGNRGVVHHMIVFMRPRGRGGAGGQESFGQLCGFAPGTRPYVLPDGDGQAHSQGLEAGLPDALHAQWSPQKDPQSPSASNSRPGKVTYRVATADGINRFRSFRRSIRPTRSNRDTDYKSDVLLLSISPHMHLRGKDFRYEVTYPDGKQETLLNVPRYDFNWQTRYVSDQPKQLPAGTKLHCTAHFDNSADNLANPDPPSRCAGATRPGKR